MVVMAVDRDMDDAGYRVINDLNSNPDVFLISYSLWSGGQY